MTLSPEDRAMLEQIVTDAIKAGCNAADLHLICGFPGCKCLGTPRIVRAALIAQARVMAEQSFGERLYSPEWSWLAEALLGGPMTKESPPASG